MIISSSAADVDRFLIDEELQACLAVLGQSRPGLLDAAERHRWLFVSSVNIDVGQACLDSIDVLLRVGEALREDCRRKSVNRIVRQLNGFFERAEFHNSQYRSKDFVEKQRH